MGLAAVTLVRLFSGLLVGFWRRLLKPALTWVFADFRHPIIVILSGLLLHHLLILDPRLRAERADAETARVEVQNTLDAVFAAQERARILDAANAARAKAEQEAISRETVHDFQTRIDAARDHAARLADAMRVRRAPGVDPGDSNTAPVSASRIAAGSPDETAGGAELPAPGTPPALSLEERLIATEQAIQLDALISWVERQSAVRPLQEGPGQ